MPRVLLGLALTIAFAAAPAHADPILYATAATTGELTSYCVGNDGVLQSAPRQRITTFGNSPSRILPHTMGGKQFLYVAENDRVEVYEVNANGRLTLNGRIPARPIPNDRASGLLGMNPHDLAIGQSDSGGSVLYIPQRAYDRIASFPLDPTTGLSTVRTAGCTGQTCQRDDQCPTAQTCINGECLDATGCKDDTDCASGQVCNASQCVQRIECNGSPCSTGEICDAGICRTSCQTNADCGGEQPCSAGVCQMCASDADCSSGQTCVSGRCRTSCTLPEGETRDSVPDAACASEGGFCSTISDQTGASCILGPALSEWEDVEVANRVEVVNGVEVTSRLFYISRAVNRGEVFVYQLAPDANFANGEVVVTQDIGAETNMEQCGRSRVCTTGVTCRVDTDCTVPPGAGLRCVAGACVNLSMPCDANKDCPSVCPDTEYCRDPICTAFGPCDQNGKPYTVPSSNCTTPIVLTDVNGNPITRQPNDVTPDPPPLTVTGRIEPYAHRRRLNGAGAVAMQNDILYVSERFRKAISAFSLCPAGGQTVENNCKNPKNRETGEPCTCPNDPNVVDLCPAFGFSVEAKFNANGLCTVRSRQPRLKRGGRTHSNIRYNAMTLAQGNTGSTLLGAQFLDGRIDGYRLKSDGRLPRTPTQRTRDNFRTSPFQMFVYRPPGVSADNSAGVLYVGAGDINRVQAYRLFANGNLRDRTPFSETDVLDDTFPNAVAVVELPGSCF